MTEELLELLDELNDASYESVEYPWFALLTNGDYHEISLAAPDTGDALILWDSENDSVEEVSADVIRGKIEKVADSYSKIASALQSLPTESE